jgi:hypothetical protein
MVWFNRPSPTKTNEADAGIPTIFRDSTKSRGCPDGVLAQTGASGRQGTACPLLAVLI